MILKLYTVLFLPDMRLNDGLLTRFQYVEEKLVEKKGKL